MAKKLIFIDAKHVYDCVEDCFPKVILDFGTIVQNLTKGHGDYKCYFYYSLPSMDDTQGKDRDELLEDVSNLLLSLYGSGFQTFPRPDDVFADEYSFDYKSVINRLVFEMLTVPEIEKATDVIVIGDEALIGFLARSQSQIVDAFDMGVVRTCIYQSPHADTDFDDYEQWADEIVTLSEKMFVSH